MKELSSLDGAKTTKPAAKAQPKPKLTKKNNTDARPLYAVAITLVLYVIAMVLYNKYPLGTDSFLISDLKDQYAPFLALMRNKIGDMGSVSDGHLISYLTYSFKLGLGKNFIGTIGYYLASPFNLIYLLLDDVQINTAILAIIIAKLSLSSGFMCLFLAHRSEDKKTLWPVLLGIMYAFSLYSQIYMFHIMWLDGYMLLPLILYFTEKFIKEQKYAGLVISLLVLFISNYYIAYMAGIACFLYLCIRLFVLKVPVKKALAVCGKYVLTAGFTALMTAVLLVPVGLDTIRNADQTVSSRGENLITYSPLTLIHMLVLGEPYEFNDLLPGNYPFLFICLLVVMLIMLYFISPLFKSRERKIHAFCFLGVLLSTALYPLDKAWQVFDDPNWFWHRQAFVFLPLFLLVSMKVLMKVKELARKNIVAVMVVMYSLVIIDFSFGILKGKADAVLFNICLITAYAALLAAFGVEKWTDQLRDMPKMIAPFMSTIVCFELVAASPMMSSAVEPLTLKGNSEKEYIQSLEAVIEYGSYANARNSSNGAFRAESEITTDYTDKNYIEACEGFYGDYNAVALFNSNSNKRLHRFTKQLGFSTNYNYFATWHTYACPSVDSFFSVGEVSARKDLAFYRLGGEDSYGTGLKFYDNDSFLPLAFEADKGAMDFDYYRLEKDASEKNYFAFQNDWYRSMFPEEFTDDFFIEIGEDVTGTPTYTNGVFFRKDDYLTNKDRITNEKLSEANNNVVASAVGYENTVYNQLKNNMTEIYRNNSNLPIVVEYEFKAPTDDELYCSLVTGVLLDETEVYVNGTMAYHVYSNTFYSQIMRLGSFNEGDDVKVTFISDTDKWTYLNIRFASFDNETFSNQIEKIDKTKVNTDIVHDGYAKFTINSIDDGDIVITTIPAEDGWQLYIDGAPAAYTAYQNALIAFEVPSGNHTAELVFTAPGLKEGAMVSCAGIVLLVAFIIIDKNISKKKEKQQ